MTATESKDKGMKSITCNKCRTVVHVVEKKDLKHGTYTVQPSGWLTNVTRVREGQTVDLCPVCLVLFHEWLEESSK